MVPDDLATQRQWALPLYLPIHQSLQIQKIDRVENHYDDLAEIRLIISN